jgi:hypothetical protein
VLSSVDVDDISAETRSQASTVAALDWVEDFQASPEQLILQYSNFDIKQCTGAFVPVFERWKRTGHVVGDQTLGFIKHLLNLPASSIKANIASICMSPIPDEASRRRQQLNVALPGSDSDLTQDREVSLFLRPKAAPQRRRSSARPPPPVDLPASNPSTAATVVEGGISTSDIAEIEAAMADSMSSDKKLQLMQSADLLCKENWNYHDVTPAEYLRVRLPVMTKVEMKNEHGQRIVDSNGNAKFKYVPTCDDFFSTDDTVKSVITALNHRSVKMKDVVYLAYCFNNWDSIPMEEKIVVMNCEQARQNIVRGEEDILHNLEPDEISWPSDIHAAVNPNTTGRGRRHLTLISGNHGYQAQVLICKKALEEGTYDNLDDRYKYFYATLLQHVAPSKAVKVSM